MTIDELLKQARELWPDTMTEQEIAIAMGVIYGDICRYVRDHSEGKEVDAAEFKKELGNTIFSTIRWCDDMGFTPQECLELAVQSNERYVKKFKTQAD
jgi:hypothetical protein